MKTRVLCAEITDYINHLSDTAYINRVLAQTDDAVLVNALLTLLRGDDAAVSDACLFIRDLIIMAPPDENVARFRQQFFDSFLVRELEAMVFSNLYRVRRDAIYTLGKTCAHGSLPSLLDALAKWREDDPLILPHLLNEIWWLQKEDDFSLLEPLASSTRFLTRWAVLESLLHIYSDEAQQQKRRYFSELSHDSHQLVREEASCCLYLLKLEEDKPSAPRKSPRFARKAHNERLQELRPVCFSDVQLGFWNSLEESEAASYTIEDLEVFVARFSLFSRMKQET